MEISPGDTRCTYTLDDVKALYQIDTELVKLQQTSALQGQKIVLQSDIIVWQKEQIRLTTENSRLANERMKSITELYIRTDKRLQTEIAKPKWGHYFAWGIAAAMATLLTGYVVADQISK